MTLVAITGAGVITPLGDSLASVGEAMLAGRSAVAPVAEPAGTLGARLPDFQASRYASVRGMRIYSRAMQLGICAARLALVDAGLAGRDGNVGKAGKDGEDSIDGKDLGLIASFSFAHLQTLLEYDRSLVTRGVQQTNPALMPLGIPSAAGAVSAIAFSAQAFSITLSDGGVGGLDALGLAARLLAQGRAHACVVLSASAHCAELALSAARAGMLAREGAFKIFDGASGGTAFGEAGVALVLEPMEEARRRGARRWGILHAQRSRFAPRAAERAVALRRAAQAVLEASGTSVAELALVSSGANGVAEVDRCEAQALSDLVGAQAGATPVVAVKAALGETLEASGLLQSALALHQLASAQAPPIVGLDAPALPGLAYARQAQGLRRGPALVTGTSITGACSALLLSNDDS